MFAAISFREEPEGPYYFDVWGTGLSKEAALEDAGEWVAELAAYPALEVREIDDLAAEYVQDVGGAAHLHRCYLMGGRVALRGAA